MVTDHEIEEVLGLILTADAYLEKLSGLSTHLLMAGATPDEATEAEVYWTAGRLHASLISIDADAVKIKPQRLVEIVRARMQS